VIFGENVGRGDSDPTVLAYQYGWSEARLVARHMTLAWVCLMLLIVLYVVHLFRPCGGWRMLARQACCGRPDRELPTGHLRAAAIQLAVREALPDHVVIGARGAHLLTDQTLR
jgi:hypothetical protein